MAIPFRCCADGAETIFEVLDDEVGGAAGGSKILNVLRTRLRCPHIWNDALLQRGKRSEALKNSDPRQFECCQNFGTSLHLGPSMAKHGLNISLDDSKIKWAVL
jgi:hypothetical protein